MPAYQPHGCRKQGRPRGPSCDSARMVGFKDYQLREVILREEFVFVTNNARDFRKLMAESGLHPGLMVIIPNVTPALQRQMFDRAISEASRLRDMINRVVEIDIDGVNVFELPKLE